MDLHFKLIQCYIKMVLQKIFGGVWKTLKSGGNCWSSSRKVHVRQQSVRAHCTTAVTRALHRYSSCCKLCMLNTKPWDNPICRKINFWQNSAAALERYMNRYSHFFFCMYTFNSAIWYVNTSVLNLILKSFSCVYKILCNLNVMEFTGNI